jgi:hypothetical protein
VQTVPTPGWECLTPYMGMLPMSRVHGRKHLRTTCGKAYLDEERHLEGHGRRVRVFGVGSVLPWNTWNKLRLRGIPGVVPARTPAASAGAYTHCNLAVTCRNGELPGLGVRGTTPSRMPISAG